MSKGSKRQRALNVCPYCGWEKGKHAGTCQAPVGHEHTWLGRAHFDGCHAYSWHYTCLCGASRKVGEERSFTDLDGLTAAMWFEESCLRCQELMAGAEPEEWDEIVEADE